ncbi:MAG: oxidoreductase [Oscillospiraceae bacterium]|nr:oxidoreductase [Oscillospiraceae bacterium]
MRYGIAVNTDNCMECYNCFMACKDEHCGFATAVSAPQPHEGQHWVRIDSKERGNDNRKVKTSNVAIMCSHCENPVCMSAATDGAVYKRPDGIVIIDPEKAKGQKQIVDACPIHAVFWNEELQLPQKCTMCAHLLDEGYAKPRCVEACPNEALYFGDLDDPESEVSKVIAKEKQTPLPELAGRETAVKYLNIPTRFLAGSVYLPGDETGEDPAAGAEVTLVRADNGEKITVKTNYFGDWEREWLEPNTEYAINVSLSGYEPVSLTATTDIDRYVGEIILQKAK